MSLSTTAMEILRRVRLHEPVQRAYARLRTLLESMFDLPGIARLVVLWRRTHPAVSAPPRDDVVVGRAPMPAGRYVSMIETLPIEYGGRSVALLDRVRMFADVPGVRCEVVLAKYHGDIDALDRQLRERGALADGVPLRRLDDFGRPGSSLHERMDALIGDDRDFAVVACRELDHAMLRYQNPNAYVVFVYHSTHLQPPYNNPKWILPSYRLALESNAHVVFLTRAQRADAEAVFGRRDRFVVIPHPVQQP